MKVKNSSYPNYLWTVVKAVLRGKFIVLNVYIGKEERPRGQSKLPPGETKKVRTKETPPEEKKIIKTKLKSVKKNKPFRENQ